MTCLSGQAAPTRFRAVRRTGLRLRHVLPASRRRSRFGPRVRLSSLLILVVLLAACSAEVAAAKPARRKDSERGLFEASC